MVGAFSYRLLVTIKSDLRSYSWRPSNKNMQDLAGPFCIPTEGKVFHLFAPECMMQWESSNEDSDC